MSNRRRRKEFSKATKAQAWDRCEGQCQKCTARLITGAIHFDHKIMAALNVKGSKLVINSLANCQVLCTNCHAGKTRVDRKIIAKAHRLEERHFGMKRKKRALSRLKRKMDGTVVDRETGERV